MRTLIRRHPGATADEMANFIKDSVSRFQPKRLIIFAGCNDIGRAHLDGRTDNDVVDSVMRMAMEGKKHGCDDIHVSSILTRKEHKYVEMIKRVNTMLETCCQEEGINYLDHSVITNDHISWDGLHPNANGTTILKMNILSCFTGFNPYLTSFYDDYEYAFHGYQ